MCMCVRVCVYMTVCVLTVFTYFLFFLSVWVLLLLDGEIKMYIKRPGDLDLWPFVLENGVRVTCNVGYLCTNFGIPRRHCSRPRLYVRDRR